MANQDNVVSFENSARARDATLSAKLIQDMRQLLIDTVPTLIQSLYDKLDDGLFEQALFEKSGKSDSLDNLFFDTMRQLRKQREGFIKSYVRKLIRQYDDFWRLEILDDEANSLLIDIKEESLTLIDDGDLEEDLALDGVIAKGMRQFSKEIYALNQRFAAMKGVAEVTDEQNPVGPSVISRVFPASITELDVDLRIKLVIYKLFEREVIQYLGAMYDDINAMLKAAGVLPKLPSRVKHNPISPAVIKHQELTASGNVDEARSIEAAQQAEIDSAEQAEIFETLRGLLQTTRVHRPENQLNLPQVNASDLMSALSGLQQQRNAGQSQALSLDQAIGEIGDLRNQLHLNLGMGEGTSPVKSFAGMDEDTIDIISMLFEFILDDTNLPDAMKALLSRLQIPMLKVAILDRKFFADKQHPARKLLNSLAKSAVGWVDDGDRSDASLFGKISSIVTRVLEEFHEDLQIFNELYEEFNQFINAEEQGAVVQEERIAEVTKGREKMKLAQIRVAEVINTRVKGVTCLPDVVKELLKEGWKDVLMLTYLRQGEESEKWIHVVGLVDKLLWSVQPKNEIKDRQKLLKSIPELLKALRAELVEISFDQHKLGRWLKQLQASHIQALKGDEEKLQEDLSSKPEQPATTELTNDVSKPDDAPKAEQTEPAVSETQVKATTPEAGKPEPLQLVAEDIIETPLFSASNGKANKDEFDEQAEAIHLGTWIDWKANDGKQLRGKLTWKSTITGTLVFVGRKGTKLAELAVTELAELLRTDKAHLLAEADQPILERAMNAMVDSLKRAEPARA